MGTTALFLARNRFAVFNKLTQLIEIKDLDNNLTKSIKCSTIFSPSSTSTSTSTTTGTAGTAGTGGTGGTGTGTGVIVNDIHFGGTGCLLLSCSNSIILFDIQQLKVLGELITPLVKYVVWSNDGNMVALLSKHSTYSFLSFPSSFHFHFLLFYFFRTLRAEEGTNVL